MGYLIGIDVGGTKTAYGLFDEKKNLVAKYRHASDNTLEPEPFFTCIADGIGELVRQNSLTLSDIDGVALAMPSFICFDTGYIFKTSNLVKIKEFAARDFLSGLLGGIPVLLDNDAHVAALAESRRGAGRDFPHMLYCPVSTGISSALIIDRRLFRGSYGFSGESGHMIATPDGGIECGCENRGCFMSWCSGSMIVKHLQGWLDEGEQSVIPSLAGGRENISARHINEAYELGDALAIRAVEQMARYFSIFFFNLYVTLNINCFVLGGGLLAFGDKLFGSIRRQFDILNHNDMPVYFKEAELGEDVGIIGAAELFD